MVDTNTLINEAEYEAEMGLGLDGVLEDGTQEVNGSYGQTQWGAVDGMLDSGGIDKCLVVALYNEDRSYMLHTQIESKSPKELLKDELDPFLMLVGKDYGSDVSELNGFAAGTNIGKSTYWSDEDDQIEDISKIWGLRGLVEERFDDKDIDYDTAWEKNNDHNTRLVIDASSGDLEYDPEYDIKHPSLVP